MKEFFEEKTQNPDGKIQMLQRKSSNPKEVKKNKKIQILLILTFQISRFWIIFKISSFLL